MRSLVAGVAMLGLVACAGSEGGSDVAANASPAGVADDDSRRLLPDAELPRLDREGALAMRELRGPPAVVNFWASWCPFCVDEIPEFEAVNGELDGRVRFVGVNLEDNLDKARILARETGVTWDLVVDGDGSYFRAVRGRGMPTTLLVDADGVIVRQLTGPQTAEQLRALIEAHLLGA